MSLYEYVVLLKKSFREKFIFYRLDCEWIFGADGKGESEINVGRLGGKSVCAKKCKQMRHSNPKINGATIRRKDGYCWCEIGMTSLNQADSEKIYSTCFLPGKRF